VIPKESLHGLRRVDLGNLGSAKRPEPTQPEARTPVPDPRPLARDEAYRQGLDEGRRQAEARLEAERTALRELGAGLNQLMQDFEEGLANDVLSMSLELAKLIVRQVVKVKPEVVLPVLREAISSLPGMDEQTTVRLHPADAQVLRRVTETDKMLAALPWKIIEDPQIERGGCVLETATTEVDATLETRWRRVIAALGREELWIDITT
jgi:flagellar assembly protein FliH